MQRRLLIRLKDDVRGTSAVEMGIICGVIVIAMMSALSGLASQTGTMWTNVKDRSSEAIAN